MHVTVSFGGVQLNSLQEELFSLTLTTLEKQRKWMIQQHIERDSSPPEPIWGRLMSTWYASSKSSALFLSRWDDWAECVEREDWSQNPRKRQDQKRQSEFIKDVTEKNQDSRRRKRGKNGFTETKRMREFSGMAGNVFSFSILFFPFNLRCWHSFIHSFFLVKNDDHFSFWDDCVLMFSLYRKKLSHNLLNLKQILAAVSQDYNIHKSGFSLKLYLLPSYSFK